MLSQKKQILFKRGSIFHSEPTSQPYGLTAQWAHCEKGKVVCSFGNCLKKPFPAKRAGKMKKKKDSFLSPTLASPNSRWASHHEFVSISLIVGAGHNLLHFFLRHLNSLSFLNL